MFKLYLKILWNQIPNKYLLIAWIRCPVLLKYCCYLISITTHKISKKYLGSRPTFLSKRKTTSILYCSKLVELIGYVSTLDLVKLLQCENRRYLPLGCRNCSRRVGAVILDCVIKSKLLFPRNHYSTDFQSLLRKIFPKFTPLCLFLFVITVMIGWQMMVIATINYK